MNEIYQLSKTRVRHILLMVICAAIVAVGALFDPLTGSCGTAPYVFSKLLGGALAHVVRSFCSVCDRAGLDEATAVVVNVGVFSATIVLLYLKGPDFLPKPRSETSTPRAWFVPALLVWTGLYLASYFFLLPVYSCP